MSTGRHKAKVYIKNLIKSKEILKRISFISESLFYVVSPIDNIDYYR